MIKGLAIGLVGLSLFGAAPDRRDAEVTTKETIHFAPGGTIRIEGSHGEVSVEGWDRPEVELTVTRSQLGLFGEKERQEIAKRLEKVLVKADRRSDKELVITTQFPAHYGLFIAPLPPKTRVRVDMEYTLRVPRDSHIAVRHKDGDVLVTDVTGEIDATARSGDVVVMLADGGTYAIDAKTKLGTVYSDFGNPKHLDYLLGERFNNGQGQKIYLRTGVGGISIQRLGK
jgi:hypothetical protein